MKQRYTLVLPKPAISKPVILKTFIPKKVYRDLAQEQKGLNLDDFFPENTSQSRDVLDTLKYVAILIYDPEIHSPEDYLGILYQISMEFGDFITKERRDHSLYELMLIFYKKKEKEYPQEKFRKLNK
jgi:hypothetical protein